MNETHKVGIEQIEHEQVVNSQTTRNVLPKQLIVRAKVGDSTPSVLNIERLEFHNLGPFTVINFKDGQPGQTVTVLGDGQTTIAENAKIMNVSGANTLLVDGLTRDYTMFNDRIWHGKQ
jgi:hypothetical protein